MLASKSSDKVMKGRFLKAEILIVIMSVGLSLISLFSFQNDPGYCNYQPNPLGPPIGLMPPAYCKEFGFPLRLVSGGVGGHLVLNLTAFVGNSIVYFVILNLGYFVYKKLFKQKTG